MSLNIKYSTTLGWQLMPSAQQRGQGGCILQQHVGLVMPLTTSLRTTSARMSHTTSRSLSDQLHLVAFCQGFDVASVFEAHVHRKSCSTTL